VCVCVFVLYHFVFIKLRIPFVNHLSDLKSCKNLLDMRPFSFAGFNIQFDHIHIAGMYLNYL